jgi:Spy/CpxP family protein refolding chaperone
VKIVYKLLTYRRNDLRESSVLIGQENLSNTMIKSLANLAFAAAFTTALVFSQTSDIATHTRPTPAQMVQKQVQFRTTLLSLTTDQQAQATTIFTNASSNSANHGGMRTTEAALKTAIQNNDAAGIEQATTTIGNMHAQELASHAKAEAAFYAILTPDQKTKYAQLESQGHFGMGFGPGFRGAH